MAESKHLFTYGDRIRRKSAGTEHVVSDIGDNAYYFSDGTFALIADQECYELMEKASGFFRVANGISSAPLDDYLQHGYEERYLFVDALRKLVARWGGRTGLNVGERNKFLLLRFYDNPGGATEEAWLPLYLLSPTVTPEYIKCDKDNSPDDGITAELDEAFGFD